MPEKKKIVVIFSGGLDSTTLIYYLLDKGYEVLPLSFNYSQKHNIELKKAKITCDKLGLIYKEIDMRFMKDLLGDSTALTSDGVEVPTLQDVLGEAQPITYVPNRNMLMLSVALSYAEANEANNICFGAQSHDEYSGYWDTTMRFVESINGVSTLNREHQIKTIAPFVYLNKAEEIVLGQFLNIPYEDTWTSYRVVDEIKEIADSTNPTSRDRIMAFARVGVKDPQKYEIELNWDELFSKYKQEYDIEEIKNKIQDV